MSNADDLRQRLRSGYTRSAPTPRRPIVRPVKVSEITVKPATSATPIPRPVQLPASPAPPVTTPSSHNDLPSPRTSAAEQEPIKVVVNWQKPAETAPREAKEQLPIQPEPVTTTPPPEIHTQSQTRKLKRSQKQRVPRTKKRVIAWGAAGVMLIGISTAGWLITNRGSGPNPSQTAVLSATSPLPAQYSSQSLGFTVYYPTKLPAGWRIAPSSYKVKDNALTFTANTANGDIIPVSEQAVPNGLDAGGLVPAPKSITVTDVQDIPLTGGKAAMSNWSGKTLISIVYGKTWLILNVTNLPKEDAISFTNSFTAL